MTQLYFKQQVDTGLKKIDEGKVIPHEVRIAFHFHFL